MSDNDRTEEKAQEIDALAAELGAWVSAKTTQHDVSMPFALARIFCERVAHDGGDMDDCVALVEAAGKYDVDLLPVDGTGAKDTLRRSNRRRVAPVGWILVQHAPLWLSGYLGFSGHYLASAAAGAFGIFTFVLFVGLLFGSRQGEIEG